jgi:putative FmdB family regulatory protein
MCPTYDYECPKCGLFEIFQSIKAEPEILCPRCGNQIKRLITGGDNIIFRGEGFHCNDYGKKKTYKEATKDERIERRKKAKKTIRDFYSRKK